MILTYYIRHTESKHSTLTDLGLQEAMNYHDTILKKADLSKRYAAHTPPAKRFTDTATLLIRPNLELLESNTKMLIDEGLLRLDPFLDYTKFGDDELDIEKEFDNQAALGTLMRDFYIKQSDGYLTRNPALSTYTTISRYMSIKALEINSDETVNANIVVTREFFWPIFRARILEIASSADEAKKYAEWYSNNKENNLGARLDVQTLIRDNDNWTIADDYGTYTFTTTLLNRIDNRDE